MTSLRIAVSNLQCGIGTTRGWWHYLATGWKYRLPHDSSAQIEGAARFLAREAIDVAMLCEVDASCRRSRWRDQLDDLCEIGPLKERAFFPTRVVGRRLNQGNAICARFPLRYVKNHALPGHGEPRFLSEAEMELEGLKVRLLMTHLALERRIRSPQIHHIAELVARGRGPTILAGDFNIAKQAELDLLRESELLERAVTGATFPAWQPWRPLDHLFVSGHFDIMRSGVFDGFLFSDHLPLVVELRLNA
jgi:endonuclease/exonuclease/phosphatase family metal-dependent hydrolase